MCHVISRKSFNFQLSISRILIPIEIINMFFNLFLLIERKHIRYYRDLVSIAV